MKKMILAALALVAFNANAQVAAVAPSMTFSKHYFECASNDAQATYNCQQAQRELDMRKQYGEMTPARQKLLKEMAETLLKNNQ